MQQYVRDSYDKGAVGGELKQKPVSDGQSVSGNESGHGSEAAPPRFCRKCFLREMMQQGALEESYRSMYERIEMMDEDLRCKGDEYEARLKQCKKCENLAEGMCRLCGCFVELRAAVKKNSCPATPKRWEASE